MSDTITAKQYQQLMKKKGKAKGASQKQRELEEVHYPLIRWLDERFFPIYPDAVLRIDPFSDMQKFPVHIKVKMIEEAKQKGWTSGEPDIVILQPTPDGHFPGIAMELKHKDMKVYKSNGELYTDPQLEKEQARLNQYHNLGFYASFFCGLDICLQVLNKLYNVPIR